MRLAGLRGLALRPAGPSSGPLVFAASVSSAIGIAQGSQLIDSAGLIYEVATGGSVLDPQHPAVCHEQCKPNANVDYRIQSPGLPPAVPTGLIVTWVDPYRLLSRASLAEPDAARANGPPLSILFCVSRT